MLLVTLYFCRLFFQFIRLCLLIASCGLQSICFILLFTLFSSRSVLTLFIRQGLYFRVCYSSWFPRLLLAAVHFPSTFCRHILVAVYLCPTAPPHLFFTVGTIAISRHSLFFFTYSPLSISQHMFVALCSLPPMWFLLLFLVCSLIFCIYPFVAVCWLYLVRLHLYFSFLW